MTDETAPPAEDLDALIRRVDNDRWLATRFVADPEQRADLIALYAFDYELARAGRATSTPLLAEIRLTWWREALDEVYGGDPVRYHPAVAALASAPSQSLKNSGLTCPATTLFPWEESTRERLMPSRLLLGAVLEFCP